MNLNHSQAQTANDVCKCRGCGVPNSISIVPDLKTNKWKCINCNLIQVWQPSSSFAQVHDTVTKVRATTGQPISLFSITPLSGIGADGCLSGVYSNPEHLSNIIMSTIGIAILAVIVEYYRVKYPAVVANGNRRDAMHCVSSIDKKAPNKVCGVDNWNRQPPILRVSAMSKAQSIARVKKQSGISFRSLPCSIHNSTNTQS